MLCTRCHGNKLIFHIETRIQFEQRTQEEKEEVLDLSEISLEHIPLLSKLLLVKKIIVPSAKLKTELNNLPFLNECIIAT